MFADEYLNRSKFQPAINQDPSSETGMIVVIPCYLEPDILKTLESLAQCKPIQSGIEVIIVINHPENSSEKDKNFNYNTLGIINDWISGYSPKILSIIPIGPFDLPKKWAGAGLARKRGMDEAVNRFNKLKNPEGIIVSLDADTLVENNYLTEIERHYSDHPDNVGATIAFRHQVEGLKGRHLEGIQLYEKYLEYYKNAVAYTGYPWSMITIGSAFTVTAEAYVKRGGMNRRKAGEDFYFLQNLAHQGIIGEIRTTCVHPSARLSDRIPFGTGPILRKWMDGETDLSLTFNFQAFIDLKNLFDQRHRLYRINENGYLDFLKKLPLAVSEFLRYDWYWFEIEDLIKNCSKPEVFDVRFFHKFNAFRILKFLNFSHEKYYSRVDLNQQAELLKKAMLSEF